MTADANIPLIYVNKKPIDLDLLGRNAAFIGSDEKKADTLQALEVCRRLKEKRGAQKAEIFEWHLGTAVGS